MSDDLEECFIMLHFYKKDDGSYCKECYSEKIDYPAATRYQYFKKLYRQITDIDRKINYLGINFLVVKIPTLCVHCAATFYRKLFSKLMPKRRNGKIKINWRFALTLYMAGNTMLKNILISAGASLEQLRALAITSFFYFLRNTRIERAQTFLPARDFYSAIGRRKLYALTIHIKQGLPTGNPCIILTKPIFN